MEGKEYKVITSNVPSFSSYRKLQEILKEEAEAGWRLFEKYDNYKIRLVRDLSARENDADCRIDPYRSHIGLNQALLMGIVATSTILVIWLVMQAARNFL